MKKMSSLKLTALLVAVMFLLTAVAGCGKSSTESSTTDTEKSTAQAEQSTTQTEQTPAEPEKKEIAPTTIKYALWGDKEKAKLEIEKFNQIYPQIKVEIDPEMDWPWDEKLAAAAAANKLPDVFWVFQTPVSAQAGLLADMTPFLEKDKDFSPDAIFGNLAETGRINGKYYSLPNALFAQMVFINKDLLVKENIPVPSSDWTFDQFVEIATKLTKPSEDQYGLESAGILAEHLYTNIDSTLGWSTWNSSDQKYHFTNPAYAQAINLARDLAFNKKVTLDTMTQEDKEKKYGKDVWPIFSTGKVGMLIDFGWNLPGVHEKSKFDWDVLPLPKVNDQRLGMVTDYIAMSAVTQSPDAAFEFVKYMTYSKEGWMNRLEIYNPYAGFPLVKDKEVWDKYLSQSFIRPGVKNLVNLIPKAYLDGMKWLPGWSASMNESAWKYGGKFFNGEAKPEDVAAEMEQKANQGYKDAMDALSALK